MIYIKNTLIYTQLRGLGFNQFFHKECISIEPSLIIMSMSHCKVFWMSLKEEHLMMVIKYN